MWQVPPRLAHKMNIIELSRQQGHTHTQTVRAGTDGGTAKGPATKNMQI